MNTTATMKIHKSENRGHAHHGWLDARHSFSFSSYYNPDMMGFRSIRVLNEDRIDAGQGFPMHPHNDMEIITYILEGGLAHKDSMGNSSFIKKGDIQRMTAGTGIVHSEMNPTDQNTHLFQIWIKPEEKGLKPGYEEVNIGEELKLNQLHLMASREGGDNAVTIYQDAKIYTSLLEQNNTLTYNSKENRHHWLQLASGSLSVNGTIIHAGDAIAFNDETEIEIKANEESEFLLFDLA